MSYTQSMSVNLDVRADVSVNGEHLTIQVSLTQNGGYYSSPVYYAHHLDTILLNVPNHVIMSEVRRRGLLNLLKDYKAATPEPDSI
jgi:hypothetical protein